MYSSERLTLAFVRSAARAGAQVANYVEALGLSACRDRVTGIQARDTLTGDRLEIRARLVVNAAGPWADDLLDTLPHRREAPVFRLSAAMNLVTRQILPGLAVGVPSVPAPGGAATRKSRLLFVAPWRGYSLIGTMHARYDGQPGDYRIDEQAIRELVAEVNQAYPGAALQRRDVYLAHKGFLPAEEGGGVDQVRLVRRSQVYDHARSDHIEGLITVVGVKYTTARHVAEQVVDLVCRKFGRPAIPCATRAAPLYGGDIDRIHDFVAHAVRQRPQGIEPEQVRHLAHSYGSEYQRVLAYLGAASGPTESARGAPEIIRAEVLHGVREEMAQRLADVVFRRAGLGAAGDPGAACLGACAAVMADEFGWSAARTSQELDEVRAVFASTAAPAERLQVLERGS
jgi:glycerol-3-phosphate dehydrogenase